MSDSTTELGLQLAVDADDTADYLTIKLRQSLQSVDSLFNQAAGHTHSGPHQGGQISSAAFAGAFDINNWFRSHGVASGAPTSGNGLDWFWDGTNGVIESVNHDTSSNNPLKVQASELDLFTGGTVKAFSFGTAASGIRLWNPDGTSAVSLRARSGNGLELVNAAYNAVTHWVDDAGNSGVIGTLSVGSTLTASGNLTVAGSISVGAVASDLNLTNHSLSGVNRITFQSGSYLYGSSDRVELNNHLDIGFDLVVGRSLIVNQSSTLSGLVTASGGINTTNLNASLVQTTSNVTAQGVIQAGAAIGGMSAGDISSNHGGGSGWVFLGDTNHRLEYNAGQNYVLRNGGLSCDWLATNTGGRNDSYALTLPNTAGTDHTGKGIATGWDSYSAQRGKTDITPIAAALAVVTHPDVHGVTYKSVQDPLGPDQIGFVAEDWHAIFPSVVALDDDGAPQGLDYGRIGALTFQAVKELAAQVAELQARLAALETPNA